MMLGRFTNPRDSFDILDLRAYFDFKSATSVGFLLGPIPRRWQSIQVVFGGLQVHHPCEGHILAYVYVQQPRRYGDFQMLSQFREVLFRELGIPKHETYELHYSDATDGNLVISHRVNREGWADRIS
jgi:hypothetical protein